MLSTNAYIWCRIGDNVINHKMFNKVLSLLFGPSLALLNEQCDLAKKSMKAKAPT